MHTVQCDQLHNNVPDWLPTVCCCRQHIATCRVLCQLTLITWGTFKIQCHVTWLCSAAVKTSVSVRTVSSCSQTVQMSHKPSLSTTLHDEPLQTDIIVHRISLDARLFVNKCKAHPMTVKGTPINARSMSVHFQARTKTKCRHFAVQFSPTSGTALFCWQLPRLRALVLLIGSTKTKMGVQHCGRGSGRGKLQEQVYSDKKLSQCHFVHDTSDIPWPGIEIGPPLLEMEANRLSFF